MSLTTEPSIPCSSRRRENEPLLPPDPCTLDEADNSERGGLTTRRPRGRPRKRASPSSIDEEVAVIFSGEAPYICPFSVDRPGVQSNDLCRALGQGRKSKRSVLSTLFVTWLTDRSRSI
jgi:hypothetical protein